MTFRRQLATFAALSFLATSAFAERTRSEPGFKPNPNRPAPARKGGGSPNVGGDTCASPPASISALPFSDSGNTCTFANDLTTYSGVCTLPFPYAGEDVIYQFTVGAGNSVAFSMSLAGSTGDLALFVVSACGNGATCERNSQDAIGPGVGPELIAAAAYPVGTHFLYVDSYYDAGTPGSCGTYTLNVTGTLPAELVEFGVE